MEDAFSWKYALFLEFSAFHREYRSSRATRMLRKIYKEPELLRNKNGLVWNFILCVLTQKRYKDTYVTFLMKRGTGKKLKRVLTRLEIV